MFSMKLPHEHMDGAKILVQTSGGRVIGNLLVYRQPKKGKVGVRIDILHPPVYHPRAAPIPEHQWVDVGHIPVTVLKLTKKQIQNIQKVDQPNYAYSIKL